MYSQQQWVLDDTYSSDGLHNLNVGENNSINNETVRDMAMLGNGQIVAGGQINSGMNFFVTRLTASGTLIDTNFGNNGYSLAGSGRP